MKIYIQIIIFAFPIIIFSQTKLEGTYYVPELSGSTYEYLTFDKEGNFKYAKGGDLGEPQPSKGHYQLKDQFLILSFNNSQSKKLGFHKTEIWRNKKDSIVVNFKVMDLDGKPLEHAWIYNVNSKSQIRTDENGTGNYILKKENSGGNFIITWLGYERYNLKVDLNYNQNIEIFLTEHLQEIPIRNQIDTLKIKESGSTYFVTDKSVRWEKSDQKY